MPNASTSQLRPPGSWDEFEDICADLFALEWKYAQVVRYGRKGQRQNGVDIYGQQDGQDAGVQCKGKRVWPPTKLTAVEIDKEVRKAKKFRPKLVTLVFATIAEDDVAIQDHVNAVSKEHKKKGLFSVHVYGWGELERRIKGQPKILEKYFDTETVPLIRDDLRKMPDQTADRVIERLKDVIGPKADLPGALPKAAGDPDIFGAGLAEAVERDYAQRYRRAMQRSLFPEVQKHDEFYPLAQPILDGMAAAISPELRRRILLRAARTTALRGNPDLSQRFLDAAVALPGPDSDLPARARLLEARGESDAAMVLLRDIRHADARSTLLTVIARVKGEAAALDWFADQRLSVADLTDNGINTLCQVHLRRGDLEVVKQILAQVTEEQLTGCPYFYLLRGAVRFALLMPKPERRMVLEGLPLDARRARLIVPDAELAAELDAVTADLQRALPLTVELGLIYAPQSARAYLVWCDLLHPGRRDVALAQLRNDMQEPAKALMLIQFALAYDPQFDPASISAYLDKREMLGGLDDDELRARLAIPLNKDDPARVAQLIAKHRRHLEGSFGKLGVATLEIQALARAGDATSARLLLEANKEAFPEQAIAAFETDIATAEGADPVAEQLRLYETTRTTDALRALVRALADKQDYRAIARYAEELYKTTADPRDIAMAAQALAQSGNGRDFVRIIEVHPFLKDYDAELRRYYAWQLLYLGRLTEAAQIANSIRQQSPAERDLNLEVALAIETGEWEQLAQPLAAFLERADQLDGPTLMRAAHLAQTSSQGPLLELAQAAIKKEGNDPGVLLGAYTLYIEEGLEEERPEANEWFRRALALSGPDGPIQRFELKELLAKQIEWNDFTRKVNESIARGEMPLLVASPGLRTTVLDVVLRNFVRNSALADPRKRSPVPLFSGRRLPAPAGDVRRIALDITALMVLAWLGLLPKVLEQFPETVLPAGVFYELFEGRRRIRQYQKSRLQRAVQIRSAIASGNLKVLRSPATASDTLTNEIGIELSALIREAQARDGIVLRPAPVHRLGLEGRDADMSACADRLCDMHTLLGFLAEQNVIDQSAETTAKQYFSLQDKGWPSSARPDIGRPILIDGLALIYLQTVNLLDTVLSTFKDVYVHPGVDEESSALIEHDRHASDVLKIVDDLRSAIRQAHAVGKIIFGPRRMPTEEESEIRGNDLSTLHLLSDMLHADILVFDDRFFNKETFAQDGTGHRAPIATSLDLIEELLRRNLITEDERRRLRYRLRIAGALLVPVDGPELAAATMRNRQNDSPEFRAIRESVDLARLAELPQFPTEMPWFIAANGAAKSAIMEIWNTETDPTRAGALADALFDLKPRPEDWVARWEGHPPPQWVEAVRRMTIVTFALPVELSNGIQLDNYNAWLERSVLSLTRDMYPELYRAVIDNLKSFMTTPWERQNGT
jgi:hypothetical protein